MTTTRPMLRQIVREAQAQGIPVNLAQDLGPPESLPRLVQELRTYGAAANHPYGQVRLSYADDARDDYCAAAVAHEAGHILDIRDNGRIDMYRYRTDRPYTVARETDAWVRGLLLIDEVLGDISDEILRFAAVCLSSYTHTGFEATLGDLQDALAAAYLEDVGPRREVTA